MATAEQDTPTTEPATSIPTPAFKFAETITLPGDIAVLVRLPNQFQHEDISLKAAAAQARRMRQLRDPESDSYIVLESDMDDLARANDRDALVEELVSRDWWKDHFEAVKDVQERDEFKTIEQDSERLELLSLKPEDERPAEEYAELDRHLTAYNDAVQKARDEHSEPRRRAYDDKDLTDLISEVREQRISAEGKQAYNRAFTVWEIALGTYHYEEHADGRVHPHHRRYGDVAEVEALDPETLSVLTNAYGALERQFNRGTVGNG